jgi:16S rRNA (cytosine967-C5)-methyltransferase
MAVALIGAVLDDGAALGDGPAHPTADPRDKAYARHLAYGTLRWFSALDWLALQLLQKPLKQKDRDIHRLLLLGLFQLWKDRTAGHAAVNETAGCARKLGKRWATGLVNAVLRRFQRERGELLGRLEQRDERFAHPDWLLSALQRDWPGQWQEIVEANNRAAPLWLRIDARASSKEVTKNLRASGLEVDRHPFAPEAARVEPAKPVRDLPGFDAGRVSVQDPAAQLAAGLLDCAPGDRVLDACAAPGGKTGHLLERYPDIDLLAVDRSEARLEQVRDNLQRLDLSKRVKLCVADAARPDTWWDGRPFDRLLLDAPCTATGVIRRHPEIKWLRTPSQVEESVSLQTRLLDALWPLLKPGGMLLYATCSVLAAENREQAAAFIERHDDAAADMPELDWGLASGPGRQILPGDKEMDGFYYARVQKQA